MSIITEALKRAEKDRVTRDGQANMTGVRIQSPLESAREADRLANRLLNLDLDREFSVLPAHKVKTGSFGFWVLGVMLVMIGLAIGFFSYKLFMKPAPHLSNASVPDFPIQNLSETEESSKEKPIDLEQNSIQNTTQSLQGLAANQPGRSNPDSEIASALPEMLLRNDGAPKRLQNSLVKQSQIQEEETNQPEASDDLPVPHNDVPGEAAKDAVIARKPKADEAISNSQEPLDQMKLLEQIALKAIHQKDEQAPYVLSGVSIFGNERYAVINGRIVTIGDSIDGAYVKEIMDRNVVIETKTSEIKLKLPA